MTTTSIQALLEAATEPVAAAAAPGSIETLLKQATERMERADFGTALQLYREALSASPRNGGAAMGLAMVLNRTGKPAEALNLLRQLWTAMSANSATIAQRSGVLAQIGLAHEQIGNLGDALEAYKQAIRLVPSTDLQRRIKQVAPLVSSPPAVQQLVLGARRLHAAGQLDQASSTFQAALKLQPENPEVMHGLALVLRALGAPAAALPLLQTATMLDPDRADYFNDLGLVFQDRKDFSKAASFHKRALKVDPHFVSAHINLGVAYKRLGKLAESEAAYREALQVKPNSPEAHNNLGNLLRACGRSEEARRHLQEAVALDPSYEEARANLAALDAPAQKAVCAAA